MNPAMKYSLGRIGIFLLCAIPAVLVLPEVNLLLKLLVAMVISAVASFFLLRQWRDEVAERMSSNARRRIEEKERLRSALAGDDDPDHPTRA
jgi:predicted membrane metal-binding protein